jgi:hypothetical protein
MWSQISLKQQQLSPEIQTVEFETLQIGHLLAILNGIRYLTRPPSASLRVHEGEFDIFDRPFS